MVEPTKSNPFQPAASHCAGVDSFKPSGPGTETAMVKPGNWYVELDDGGRIDMSAEVDGAVKLEIGEILRGAQHGRRWRVDRVEADDRYAHAVPHEADVLMRERPEFDPRELVKKLRVPLDYLRYK
jgi:hypothetical protein